MSTLRFLDYKLDLYINKNYIQEHRACRLVKHLPDQNFIKDNITDSCSTILLVFEKTSLTVITLLGSIVMRRRSGRQGHNGSIPRRANVASVQEQMCVMKHPAYLVLLCSLTQSLSSLIASKCCLDYCGSCVQLLSLVLSWPFHILCRWFLFVHW